MALVNAGFKEILDSYRQVWSKIQLAQMLKKYRFVSNIAKGL